VRERGGNTEFRGKTFGVFFMRLLGATFEFFDSVELFD
jgi:hypothetical protein